MPQMSRRLIPWLLVALLARPDALPAQGGPPPEVRAAVQSIEQMLLGSDEASLKAFLEARVAPAFRTRVGSDSLVARMRAMRQAVGGRIDDVGVMRTPDGMTLQLSGAREVAIDFDLDADARITRLELAPTPGRGAPGRAGAAPTALEAAVTGMTWETLASSLDRAETAGFSGVFLARRDGRDVLRRAYGLADRANDRRNALETVFGIGSTPIDFTRVGILLLAQRGRLAMDDSIGKYFANVPADKRGMTLRHLMSGRSGLPDFHDIPAQDWDPDLAWIDRETAVRRILAQPLLFAPGTRDQHSHSAFGLLAAAIEIVSGKSYQEFTRQEILAPLGMSRTGFYGESLGLGVGDFAVGYGASAVGVPNIPPNWGPTSWLVMGSGGMFSTLGDMERFYAAVEAGRLLTGEWARWLQGPGVDVGGSDRGFFILRATNGRGTQVLYLMNGEGRAPAARALMRSVEQLVEPR
jgi:CubicO group peptidase (beta-lactamase class C family)